MQPIFFSCMHPCTSVLILVCIPSRTLVFVLSESLKGTVLLLMVMLLLLYTKHLLLAIRVVLA